jgi:hypothetical protein
MRSLPAIVSESAEVIRNRVSIAFSPAVIAAISLHQQKLKDLHPWNRYDELAAPIPDKGILRGYLVR